MKEERNNVVLINTDHWFSQLLGCNGHEVIMTPTLDHLAKNGVLYDNCYSECPVCIPARRTLMTGTSPKTHGDRIYSDTMPMPNVPTMAETFKQAGYQTCAVGKLHVYPQRNRIGFDEAIILEEGRYDFGVVDDYQIWLGEHGYVGEEFMHAMGSNTYYTRPYHLPEEAHPTNWVTKQAIKQLKRKDPTKPGFFYVSYQAPHPPLVPLQVYLDMYKDEEIDEPVIDDWQNNNYTIKALKNLSKPYSHKEIIAAKKAFYALCTHIDHQIRLIIGTLREMNILDNTVIMFLSDHGDMLFDHDMVLKRCFYERSSNVPLILSGKPVEHLKGKKDSSLISLKDIMPTLLDLCGIDIPESVEGHSILSDYKNSHIYGEIGTGITATRMMRKEDYKLVYYPVGNKTQLFNIKDDPNEKVDLSEDPNYKDIKDQLQSNLVDELYGSDIDWLKDGKLVGVDDLKFEEKADYAMYNQRGFHWPAPSGYKNIGTNA